MSDDAWLDMVQIDNVALASCWKNSSATKNKETPKAFMLFAVRHPDSGCATTIPDPTSLSKRSRSAITATTVRWLPSTTAAGRTTTLLRTEDDAGTSSRTSSRTTAHLHPLLYEFLVTAATMQQQVGAAPAAAPGNTDDASSIVGTTGSTTPSHHPEDWAVNAEYCSTIPEDHGLRKLGQHSPMLCVTLQPMRSVGAEQEQVLGDTTPTPPGSAEGWFGARAIAAVVDLPASALVQVQCVDPHCDDDDPTNIAAALQGRWIQRRTMQMIRWGGTAVRSRHVALVIHDIVIPTTTTHDNVEGSNDDIAVDYCYRVGAPGSYSLQVLPPPPLFREDDTDDDFSVEASPEERSTDGSCPGYESHVQSLVQLLTLPMARPTGILLTGSAGVGKSRLVASALQRQAQCSALKMHRVSVHHLVLQASGGATEEELMTTLVQSLVPPTGRSRDPRHTTTTFVLVLDDLDTAGNGKDDDPTSYHNHERRRVRNAILQVVDQMVKRQIPVLGIGTDTSQVPAELVQVGRLEKELCLLPPSQRQREQILRHILRGVLIDERQLQQWPQLLATLTVGCVASDLQRLCTDAWNRSLARRSRGGSDGDNSVEQLLADITWTCGLEDTTLLQPHKLLWNDLAEAARNCVPSQLSALDVKQPRSFLPDCAPSDWLGIHQRSWASFVGYARTKQRIYRTVVVPWRRLVSTNVDDDNIASTISTTAIGSSSLPNKSTFIAPPSGVLFHGPSGCGKSKAAICLGTSLGMPMISVRTADVLDKWLGGSEAAIRSLFQRARAAAPCILFFDEIDAIASNRAGDDDDGTNNVMSRLLSTFLNEMDGVSSTMAAAGSKVLVVACTNRLEKLDAALLRPGRLEEHILLEKPNMEDIRELLGHCWSRAPLDKSLDLDVLASEMTDKDVSCAVVEGTCREAVFYALRRYSQEATTLCLTVDDVRKALVALKV